MATDRLQIIITAKGTRTVKRKIEDIGKSAGVTRKALAFMRAALVVFASVQIIRRLLDVADAFTIIRNKLKLVTGSVEELNTVQNALFKISRETRTSFQENVTLFARLARSTTRLKLTFGQLLKATKAVALATKISAATTEEAKAGIIQFAQGMAAGALAGDELRSVVEQLTRLADAIGRAFNRTGGELRSFNKQQPGVLKTGKVIIAIIDELEILGLEFKQTVPTIADGFIVLQSALIFFLGNMNKATGIGRALSDVLLVLADNIGRVIAAIAAFAGLVILNLIVGQIAALSTTIFTVGFFAARVFGGILLTVIKALLLPVRILTAAFGLLRFAIITNPLFLFGAAVVLAVIAAFFIFEDVAKKVTDALGDMGITFDNIATAAVAVVLTIIESWRKLPEALGDIAIQATNLPVVAFTKMRDAINKILAEIFNTKFTPIDLSKFVIDNPFAGAADSFAVEIKSTFEKLKLEGGGIDFVKKKFQSLLDLLDKFSGKNLFIDPEILKKLATIIGGLSGDATPDELRSKFKRLLSSVSPLAAATFKLAKAHQLAIALEDAQIDTLEEFGFTSSEVTRRIRRDIVGVGNAMSKFEEQAILLNEAFKDEIISLGELDRAVRKNRITLLESQQTAAAGVERFFLKMQRDAADTASQVEDALTTAFQAAEDAFIKFLETGKLGFADFVSSILTELSRLAFRQAVIGPIANALGLSTGGSGAGSGGGLLGSLFGSGGSGGGNILDKLVGGIGSFFTGGAGVAGAGPTPSFFTGSASSFLSGPVATGSVPGGGFFGSIGRGLSSLAGLLPFAQGGQFQVGGVGGIDRNILSINDRPVARVSRGETVNVSPSGAAAGTGVNIVFNVSTPDANSFQRSQGQIMSKIGGAINRAQQRNN